MWGALRISVGTLVTGGAIFFASLTAAQVPSDMSAYMPSKEDVRKSLVAAGMTPAQIEQALSSMSFPDAAPELAEKGVPAPCADENNNDICDIEKNDPVITTCRKDYVNIIEKTATDSYGDYLGTNSLRVSQICGMASLGGTMHEEGGAVYADVKQYSVNPIIDYWETIRKYSVNIYGKSSPMPELEDMNDAALEGVIAHLPPAFRDMNNSTGGFRTRAMPVFNKCESIRRRVADLYSRDVVDRTICVKHLPPPAEVNDLEVPSDE